jgi:hypothetical protein
MAEHEWQGRLSEAVVSEALHMGGGRKNNFMTAAPRLELKRGLRLLVSPNLTPIREYVTLLKLNMKFRELSWYRFHFLICCLWGILQ